MRWFLIVMWILLTIGLVGAAKVSYTTFTQENPCPNVKGIYVCYVVLISYAAMVFAQIMSAPIKHLLFYTGWLVAFTIALAATVIELSIGQTCPKSAFELPLCYVSLGLTIAIIGLMMITNMTTTHKKMTF